MKWLLNIPPHLNCVATLILWNTRSQAVARAADRTASQHLWRSRDVIGYLAIC